MGMVSPTAGLERTQYHHARPLVLPAKHRRFHPHPLNQMPNLFPKSQQPNFSPHGTPHNKEIDHSTFCIAVGSTPVLSSSLAICTASVAANPGFCVPTATMTSSSATSLCMLPPSRVVT